PGTPLAFTVSGQKQKFFTLFDLASDGTVNFLYPLETSGGSDPAEIPLDKPYRLDLTVQPPFGADHLVAIASDRKLTGLHQALASFEGKPAAAELGRVLGQAVTGSDFQIGIYPSFTAP